MHFLVIVLTTTVTIFGAASLLERIWTLISRAHQSMHPVLACGLGLAIGLLLACGARCGSAPKMRSAFFLRPAAALLAFVAAIATVAGVAGYFIFRPFEVEMWQPLSGDPAFARQPDSPGLRASQLGGAGATLIGGGALAFVTLKVRRRAQAELLSPTR